MTGMRPTMGSRYRVGAGPKPPHLGRRPDIPGLIGSFKSIWVKVARVRAIRRFTVRPVLPPALTALGELAGNLRWSWHPETQDVFEAVNPTLWESTGRDPVKLLGAVGRTRLEELAHDEEFVARLDAASADLKKYLTGDRWYQRRL